MSELNSNIRADITTIPIKKVAAFFIMLFILYIGFAVYFHLVGYKMEIPEYMHYDRAVMTICYFMMLALCFIKIEKNALFIVVTTFFFLSVLYVKQSYYSADLDEFGIAVDSYKYMDYGFKYYTYPFNEFIGRLYQAGFKFDDLGYFTFIYYTYSFFPDYTTTTYIVVIVNMLLLYVSMLYIYKSLMLLQCSDFIGKLASVLYGASPFLIVTVSCGLKELMFNVFIILAMYNMIKVTKQRSIFNILWSLLWISFCALFRSATAYSLLLSLIVSATLTKRNSRMYLYVILGLLLLTSTILPYLVERLFGVSLEFILAVNDYRYTGTDMSYKNIISVLAGVLGPFPNFDRPSEYAFMHSVFAFISCFMHIYFLVAIYKVIKNNQYIYYPMILYVIMTIVMNIVSGVTLDMRFHITYMPFFFILAVPNMRFKPLRDISFGCVVVAIFLAYSTRAVSLFRQ